MFTNQTITEFSSLSDIIVLFQNVIWVIIFLIAIIGIFFWIVHNDYRRIYLLENPSKPEFLTDLVTKGIEGGIIGSVKLLKMFIYNSIFIIVFFIVFGIISYHFFGLKGLLLVIFLDVIISINMNIIICEIIINRGLKNDNYISAKVYLDSFGETIQSIISFLFSKKIIHSLFIIITTLLFIGKIELFYFWAFLWILYYGFKLTTLFYKIKLMENPPIFVNIEYSNGEIEKNLILYQTTQLDYRFKRKSSIEEIIVPSTSIKNIQFSYDIELNQLDELLKLEIVKLDRVKSNFAKKFLEKLFRPFITEIKPKLWYAKAIIYSKMDDLTNAEKCLKEAINLDDNLKEFAKYDTELENIQNEKWFQDIIEDNVDV